MFDFHFILPKTNAGDYAQDCKLCPMLIFFQVSMHYSRVVTSLDQWLLEDTSRSTDAIAITRAHLKVIKQLTFRDLLTRNASFSFGIIQLLCSRLRDLSKHYEAVGLLPVEIRVARLLCEMLYEKESAKREEVHTLRLDLSQNELGLLVGTTRQRANAALTALERAGAIKRSARRLTCNEEKLRKFAQFDCP
ncbi:Crp/Fnr family transcriptional regulator [Pseudorhodoplanes sp.]|uniref:Crp/Fnr family transcriptional regulator n=1 Tax=Pseudorhodoplanes sp. TaxID=1934341 RepID=UPI003D0F3454